MEREAEPLLLAKSVEAGTQALSDVICHVNLDDGCIHYTHRDNLNKRVAGDGAGGDAGSPSRRPLSAGASLRLVSSKALEVIGAGDTAAELAGAAIPISAIDFNIDAMRLSEGKLVAAYHFAARCAVAVRDKLLEAKAEAYARLDL